MLRVDRTVDHFQVLVVRWVPNLVTSYLVPDALGCSDMLQLVTHYPCVCALLVLLLPLSGILLEGVLVCTACICVVLMCCILLHEYLVCMR